MKITSNLSLIQLWWGRNEGPYVSQLHGYGLSASSFANSRASFFLKIIFKDRETPGSKQFRYGVDNGIENETTTSK